MCIYKRMIQRINIKRRFKAFLISFMLKMIRFLYSVKLLSFNVINTVIRRKTLRKESIIKFMLMSCFMSSTILGCDLYAMSILCRCKHFPYLLCSISLVDVLNEVLLIIVFQKPQTQNLNMWCQTKLVLCKFEIF